MIRLRAEKHQRRAPKPGRQLGHDAAARRRPRRAARALRAGYGDVGAAGEHRDGRPPASSAPACAAESTPSASPETTGTPAADSPRPSARATSSPYAESRGGRRRSRPPSAAVERRRVAGDVQDGGRVGQLAQPRRDRRAAQRQTRASPAAPRAAPRARPASNALVARGAMPARRERRAASSSGSASTRAARVAQAPLDVDAAPRQRARSASGAAQAARRTRRVDGAAVMPPAAARGVSSRRPAATRDVLGADDVAAPSRSAIVRATRRTRSWPRAVRRSRSCSS